MLAGFFRSLAGFRTRSPNRIVTVLEPYGLGDIITHEPLVRELRGNGFKVTLVGNPAWAVLYPDGDRLTFLPASIPWTTYQEKSKYKTSGLFSPEFKEFRRKLKTRSVGGIGLDTRGDIRSVLLLYLAGCKEVYTLDNYLGSTLRIPPFAAKVLQLDESLMRWEMNLQFANALGISRGSHLPPRFPHLQISGGRNNLVALVAVAPWEGKLWGREKWADLVARLRAEGREIVALCGPNQENKASAEVGPDVRVRVCNSILDWTRELQQAALVISLDSGPMHLAAALDVNVIGMFGQGKLPLWLPGGCSARVIHHQDDPDFVLLQPVEENTRDAKERMGRISVEEVLEAARAMLSQPLRSS